MRRCATRARRTMGRSHSVRIDACVDAVDVAKTAGESRRGFAQVHHLGAIDLEAFGDVGPVGDRRKDFEPDLAHVPAERAPRLAAEGVVEFCFRDGEHVHDGFVHTAVDRLSANCSVTAADHHDHQRPEAPRDADQSRQVAQEPQGDASTLHAADYTTANTPADSMPVFPQMFGGSG